MNNIFIKVIFLLITLYILMYCGSYAKYEITKKNHIISGIVVFVFTLTSVIFANVVFWIK